MKLFRVEMTIAATAYIRAESAEEAEQKAEALAHEVLEVSDDNLISGLDFDDPDLPEVSLSPAMTILGRSEPAEEAEDK